MRQDNKKNSEFMAWIEKLPEADAARVRNFFQAFPNYCKLDKKGMALLRQDFENALRYYHSKGTSLEQALAFLDLEQLGDFYTRPPTAWYSLDNSAKIYPLTLKPGQMNVFRLSFYMKEHVVPELLQMALNFTIKRFPSFATTVKKGFFWHYLAISQRRYKAKEETRIPCQPLDVARSGSQTFRVLWYRNRISVEFFHILTDGTGGLQFLKALTAEYLKLCGVSSSEDGILKRNEAPNTEELANAFEQARPMEKGDGFIDKAATQLSGKLSKIKPCQVLHFKMDAAALKTVAKQLDATITAYVLAKMFLALAEATDGSNGKLSIQVPINLRQYYPSKTLRNFTLFCGVQFAKNEIKKGSELVREVASQLKTKASREAMEVMMNSTRKMVVLLRYFPLALKSLVARKIYGFLSDSIFTTRLSNMGLVHMPEEYAGQIESMDFILGPGILNRVCAAMVSFGNTATLTITKMTTDSTFEEAMYRLFTEDGLRPEVEGTVVYGR